MHCFVSLLTLLNVHGIVFVTQFKKTFIPKLFDPNYYAYDASSVIAIKVVPRKVIFEID